jgi:EAL domain-containing protein (putative c-di-GMP-specific phosphodiesterase class I)
MQRLRTAGCHIAIDDFGVGFSALGYLHRLPFDTLKIDKMFVDEIHTKPASKAIATAIVALAKSMGKNVVAEGVEHQQQVDVLDGLGVDEYQGFFFSRPLSNEAFSKMLSIHGTAGPAGLPSSTVRVAGLGSHAQPGTLASS